MTPEQKRWFTYGYDDEKEGWTRRNNAPGEQLRKAYEDGYVWAQRGGTWDGEKGSIPSPESAGAPPNPDNFIPTHEPGIDDPYKELK